jgi:DNA polymerase-3 subunit epsilon
MRLRAARTDAAATYKRTPGPLSSTLWRDASWCVIDLELTGLDRRGEIIAIGALPVREGRVILGEALYTLARPARPSHSSAVLVHKLRSPDLAHAPPLGAGIERLLCALAGSVPVFHTAAVEQAFLGRELRRRHLRLAPFADTEVLGRLWLRHRDGADPRTLRLARLAAELRQQAYPPHHALADAVTTAQAFIALASHLDAVEPQTVGRLVGAGDLLAGTRRFGPQ